jgi:hypothetical protein
VIEGPRDAGLFSFPGPVESHEIDVEQRLDALNRELGVRERFRQPLAAARSTDDEGNVHFLNPSTGARIATVPGVGKKGGARLGETPAEKRARQNFERGETDRQTQERVEATANVLLDDAGGDPERALRLLEQEITRPTNPERGEFLSRQRIAIRQLLKGARTEGAPSRPREANAGDQALADILAIDAEQLDVMRAISRDMPLKLARAVEMVRNEPDPEPSWLNSFGQAVGLTAAPQRTTIEEALAAQAVGPEDIALLKSAGIDVTQLGRKRPGLGKAKPKAKRGLVPARSKPADPLGIR